MALTMHTISGAEGSRKRRKRIGRGNASGHGTYSTRGQKGQGSRSGVSGLKRLGMRRLLLSIPKKRGFKSLAEPYHGVNVGTVNDNEKIKNGELVNLKRLIALGIVDSSNTKIKILGDGKLTKALKFKGFPVTASARVKIEAAKGSIE